MQELMEDFFLGVRRGGGGESDPDIVVFKIVSLFYYFCHRSRLPPPKKMDVVKSNSLKLRSFGPDDSRLILSKY